MAAHSEHKHFPYTTDQLYTMVSDVKKYPEFLPWCSAARILERGDGYFIAELKISYKAISESYTSRVCLTPPDAKGSAEIHVALIKGPFDYLTNHWVFRSDGNEGCEVDFHIDFKFKTKLLDTLIGAFFSKVTQKMVGAFSDRADALYGA